MEIRNSLLKLLKYVEKEDYTGYDLYDGLKITDSESILNNYYLNTAITQVFKNNPVNLRKLSGIKKTKMPKAMGLFLNAYATMAASVEDENEKKHYVNKAEDILLWLENNKINGYSGYCWNFGFNYRFMFDAPTVVITAIIAKGIYKYYRVTGSNKAKYLLLGIENFITKDLPITDTKDGICFSYTPLKKDACFNASMLAAETLAMIYSITKNNDLLNYIDKAVHFTLAYQKNDGRWNYSLDLNNGVERAQVDFHQGYVLESIYNILMLTCIYNGDYEESLIAGSKFYFNEQFFKSGQSKWRIPRVFPVDIHNQAQGIITFSLLRDYNPEYLSFANTIAEWTIENMQSEEGYFYFRKNRLFTNNISYMRWSQAWMLLALTNLYKIKKGKECLS